MGSVMMLVFGVVMGRDDDTRSVVTVVLHELERVDEEDKEHLAKQMLVVPFRWPSSTRCIH